MAEPRRVRAATGLCFGFPKDLRFLQDFMRNGVRLAFAGGSAS
jgi:hypothetical protein